jgi:multimeric flavodoxin WrbA
MKSKVKLLAIIGSQRKNGNSYLLAKTVLESLKANYEIIQFAKKEIEFCNLCEKCIKNDCVLEDDFSKILEKMKNADGIIFAFPKYVLFASKFICFLERIATMQHMREHMGYKVTFKNPDYRLFSAKKPFCIFVTSGTGKIEKENLQIVADYIEGLGLKLVPHDLPPFVGANVKAGDDAGEVLKNTEGIEECRKLTEKLIASIANGDPGTLHS